jgi:hypothetical protein
MRFRCLSGKRLGRSALFSSNTPGMSFIDCPVFRTQPCRCSVKSSNAPLRLPRPFKAVTSNAFADRQALSRLAPHSQPDGRPFLGPGLRLFQRKSTKQTLPDSPKQARRRPPGQQPSSVLHPSAHKGIEVPEQQACYTCRSPSWCFYTLEEPCHEARPRRDEPRPSLTPVPSLFHLGRTHGLLPTGLYSTRRSTRVSTPHPPLPLQCTLWRPARLRRFTPPGKQRPAEACHLPSWHCPPLRFSLSLSRPTASCGLLSRALPLRPRSQSQAPQSINNSEPVSPC